MEDDYTPRTRVSITRSAAIAMGLMLALVGSIGGYVANSIFSEPVVVMPPPEVIKEELTEAELRELAEDLIASEQDKALKAQSRVQTLQDELSTKEAELAALRSNKAANAKHRSQLKEELAFLQVQLAAAEEERNHLRKELKNTLKELDFQINQTRTFKRKAKHYKMESTANLWSAFVSNAKVEICDHGTKKRHENCHVAVEEAMSSQVRGRFTVCVDTFQSVPVLKQAGKKDALPRYSATLSDDNKFTRKGWYILFCDPSLPEAGDPDLEGDDVPTYKSVYGEHEDEVEDETMGGTTAPDPGPEPSTTRSTGSDEELDLGDIDLDFEF